MGLVESPRFPAAIATETDMQNWKNLTAGTTNPTLQNSMLSTGTTALLATGTGVALPSDNFTVTIGSEIMFVTSRSGDTLNIGSRGYEGTTAAAHNAGVVVYQMVTAKAHNQLVSEINAIESQLGINLANVIKTTAINANSGVAGLDSSGLLSKTHLPNDIQYIGSKDVSNGYAGLDTNGKLKRAEFPPANYTTVLAATTLSNLSNDTYFVQGGASSYNIVIPSAVGLGGYSAVFIRTDSTAGIPSLVTSSGQTINGQATYQLINQYQRVEIISDNSNWYIRSAN